MGSTSKKSSDLDEVVLPAPHRAAGKSVHPEDYAWRRIRNAVTGTRSDDPLGPADVIDE
jgi:hypothetical protein